MSGESRILPSEPSLRYLKLEAKRRLAAGEFRALHDAQVAIAWEHGLPSWAALKRLIEGQPQAESHALQQLSWVISRFADAGQPGWTPPGGEELREHFDERFLAAIPAEQIIASIAAVAGALREEPVVVGAEPLAARVRLGGIDVFAAVDAEPPYRLTGLQGYPLGERITDPRVAAPPPARTLGDAPAEAAALADEALAELGLVALALAGGDPGGPAWVVAKGWADLDRGEVLEPGHRFPATGITALVTATAVLRLVAEGRFGLDTPANEHLRTVRLADDTITVRELLSHTGGADSPDLASLYADSVPDLVTVTGPVIGCDGPRGVVQPSNGGYAALGQLVADVTGSPYADAAARLVLEPLAMTRSSFPRRAADLGPDAVTSYDVTPEGRFVALPRLVCTLPAAGGLWAPLADLVRLGTGWPSLLPAELAREAVSPVTPVPSGPSGPSGPQVGLGWFLGAGGSVALHGGSGPDASGALAIRVRGNRAQVVLTSRQAPVDSVAERLMRSVTNPVSGTGTSP